MFPGRGTLCVCVCPHCTSRHHMGKRENPGQAAAAPWENLSGASPWRNPSALAPASHPAPSAGAEPRPLQALVLLFFTKAGRLHGASVEMPADPASNISGNDRERGLAVLGMLTGTRAARSSQELTEGRASTRALPWHSELGEEESRSRNQDP